MPCHVYLMQQVQDYSKLFSTHIGQDIGHLYPFLHLYLIHLNPMITTLTMDYGVLTISTLSIPLFFRGQGFPHMSTLDQNIFTVFWYSCHICHRFRRAFLAIFHAKVSLILVYFCKLSLFYKAPTLMEIFQAQIQLLKIDLTTK